MSEILAYIYDFLSIVFENEEIIDEIKEIILYGSYAKKTYDEESDIDLFFNIKNKDKSKEVEEKLKKTLKSFEIKAEKTWKLKNIDIPISFIVGSLNDEMWKGIKDEIASSGIILYGTYKELPEKVSHYILFSYSLNNLKRKEKMKFIRTVFGYSLIKNKKEYKQKGILESIDGKKLSSNALLIPSKESLKIKKIFSEFKIKYNVFESWVRI
ncbi:nucleotidyltransferase domain-containing protein [Candidatus Pacearchaeota archaeon]|nr:nucleotidyltransferase domain-containing protein [Candidatus Pacearchaeota archaeon]